MDIRDGSGAIQGSGILTKNKTTLFLGTPKIKPRTGLDFSPKKNPVPSRGPSGEAWSDFFSRHGRAGTGLDFLFGGRRRDWIFFSRAGRIGDGTGFFISLFLEDGTGFFVFGTGRDWIFRVRHGRDWIFRARGGKRSGNDNG